MKMGQRILIIAIASCVVGGIGGIAGTRFFGAPFYFGFFFSFVLAGLIGMFVLAAAIEDEKEKQRQQRKP